MSKRKNTTDLRPFEAARRVFAQKEQDDTAKLLLRDLKSRGLLHCVCCPERFEVDRCVCGADFADV